MDSLPLRENLMQIRRLFVDNVPKPSDLIPLNQSEHHYATRVMRLKPGQAVELISKEGCMEATLESISSRESVVRVLSAPEIKNEPSVTITLFQGIPDHLEKLELIVQKCVELGISRIVPFTSRYTDAKYGKMDVKQKMDRIQKIAKEAVRQCGRTKIPLVDGPVPFGEIGNDIARHHAAFLFYEKSMNVQPKQTKHPETIAVIVGPEGGFSEEESGGLTAAENCTPIHLPGRILRTETAAVACVTLIQARFGDYQNVF